MTKELFVIYTLDSYENIIYEELWDSDSKSCLFRVGNLDECPEDAIIGRSLFEASEAIALIRHGLNLAKEGYDSISVTYLVCPEDIDSEEFLEEYLKNDKGV